MMAQRGRPRKVKEVADIDQVEEDFVDPEELDPEDEEDDFEDLDLEDEVEEEEIETVPEKAEEKGLHAQTIDKVTAKLEAEAAAEEAKRKEVADAAIKQRRAAATNSKPAAIKPKRAAGVAVPQKIDADLLRGLRSQLEQVSSALSDADDAKLHKVSLHIAQAITWLDAVKKFG